jgi:hypothetical protein
VIILLLVGHFSHSWSSWLCVYWEVVDWNWATWNLGSCPDRSNTRYAFRCSFKLVGINVYIVCYTMSLYDWPMLVLYFCLDVTLISFCERFLFSCTMWVSSMCLLTFNLLFDGQVLFWAVIERWFQWLLKYIYTCILILVGWRGHEMESTVKSDLFRCNWSDAVVLRNQRGLLCVHQYYSVSFC